MTTENEIQAQGTVGKTDIKAAEKGKPSGSLARFTTEELDLIKRTVAQGATDAELKLFLYVAGSRGLNPLTGQIHFVKRGERGGIQTGIDGLRLIAQRTGCYVPSSKPTDFDYDETGSLVRATVYGQKIINNTAYTFSASARFAEYAQWKRDGTLFEMWKKMPETMLEKCAEAKMLRRGFPEELSGIYTHDEMAQADNPTTIVEMPQVIPPDTKSTPLRQDEGEGSSQPQDKQPDDFEAERLGLQNHGDLMGFARKWWGKSHQDVLAALGVKRGQDIPTSPSDSALQLVKVWGLPLKGLKGE